MPFRAKSSDRLLGFNFGERASDLVWVCANQESPQSGHLTAEGLNPSIRQPMVLAEITRGSRYPVCGNLVPCRCENPPASAIGKCRDRLQGPPHVSPLLHLQLDLCPSKEPGVQLTASSSPRRYVLMLNLPRRAGAALTPVHRKVNLARTSDWP